MNPPVNRAAPQPCYVYEMRRTLALPLRPKARITNSGSLFTLMQPIFEGLDQEEFWILCLDAKNVVVAASKVSQGTKIGSPAAPREFFSFAILHRAVSVVAAHNHPSGDPEPSPEDEALTRRLVACGELLGIPVLDHVVLGEGSYVSFLERDLIPSTTRTSGD